MMSLLEGRVVLVNGATQGLGAGIARAAVREGATVAITGRRRELGEALAAELDDGAHIVEVGQGGDLLRHVHGLPAESFGKRQCAVGLVIGPV